jgi:2-methylcitrate dehydratase PrpD
MNDTAPISSAQPVVGHASAPVLAQLAERAVATMRDAPPEALHAARRCLVDWLGVAVAGMREPPPRTLARIAGGDGAALSRLGLAGAPAFVDAMVMGAAGHVLDYDDTDPVNLVHVSSSLLPALLATARRHPVDGRTFLAATVAGFEIESRLAHYLGRPLTASGWHVSGVIGPFGAAAGAALLAAQPAPRVAQAMAIAATGASGFIAAFGTTSKALQLGRAAGNGVLAAGLAAENGTGPLAILDGPPGFATTLTRVSIADGWRDAIDHWGNPYAIGVNAFKPHASCMITHPTIDAACAIGAALAQDGVAWQDVARVHCTVNRLAPQVAGHTHPRTGLEGKFSVAYCAVLGVLHERATPELFAPETLASVAVQTLLTRTNVEVGADIGEQQSLVEVTLANGRRYCERTTMAKGQPANPLTDDELAAKFAALARAAALPAHDALLAGLWRFDAIGDVRAWIAHHLD